MILEGHKHEQGAAECFAATRKKNIQLWHLPRLAKRKRNRLRRARHRKAVHNKAALSPKRAVCKGIRPREVDGKEEEASSPHPRALSRRVKTKGKYRRNGASLELASPGI